MRVRGVESLHVCRIWWFGRSLSCKLRSPVGRDSFALVSGRRAISMRPKERRESGQNDLFRARLDQIVDVGHPLVKLGKAIDWRFLEDRFGAAYSDRAGHPPLPTRLMAGLAILKSVHDLSDEGLCARWIENP